ncbi:MAG: NfeD family protein [Pseudomonadota bacterium]|nr:NfeD family protein [Pseudomonadota bacterium]
MDIDLQFSDQIRFWHWWILGLALLLVEIVVAGTFFIWMGSAAFVVGLALLVSPELGWEGQVLAFAVLSVATVIGWRVWLRRHPTESDDPALNERGAQYMGQILTLVEPAVNGIGKAKVGDSLWRISLPDQCNLAEGARVKVTGVQGATLTVELVIEDVGD